MKNFKGFTLIEVVVAVSILTVFVFGVVVILNDIFVQSNQELLSMDNIDQARTVESTFTNEIRNATIGSDGSFPLNQAGNNEIIFYSNFGSGTTVKRIRYYLSGETLYKGVVSPSGNPLTYNLSSETIKSVMAGLKNGTEPAFYYYNGNYSGTQSAIAQPVNINQVKFVKINLLVLNQSKPNEDTIFSMASGATIRAVKDNLGN